mmetsp:Transcript_16717/g.48003  ORF Transcript_16717/g.48003 Transcript_16717/m.48003 type:complete len:83 (+) Transcript_16717:218-466(+)
MRTRAEETAEKEEIENACREDELQNWMRRHHDTMTIRFHCSHEREHIWNMDRRQPADCFNWYPLDAVVKSRSHGFAIAAEQK